MTKKITVWGRDFDIKVIYDVFSGEEILNEQKESFEAFLSKSSDLLSDSTEVEKYCIKHNKKEIGESISNIFKYVIPTAVLIKRDMKKRKVALLCNYRFDEEHGLALVFENEKLVRIGTQDDV